MKTRQLGKTDMNITPIGYGSWAIGGNNWAVGWGPQDDQQAIAAIKRALNLGINWIDTAAVYGLGHSEELVGQALKGGDYHPYIFTKCSRLWDDKGNPYGSLKADSIRREAEASLKRLQVDVIDLYQMHWPDPEQDIEEGWTEMARLKEEGKVRYIGVSNFSVRADAPSYEDRAYRLAAAALFVDLPGSGAGIAAFLPGTQYRGTRLFADGVRASHRVYDTRAHCEFTGR